MPPPIRVELIPHSPEWVEAARIEAARISRALGLNIVAVHHIGSTAISSIRAKPILDLMPEARSLEALDQQRALLEGLGYQWWGEYGIANRRYCTLDGKESGVRKVQLHCFQQGDLEIERHLSFRDYLISHPDKAKEYEAEKLRCQALSPGNSHEYSDAKADWIAAQMPAALEYYRSTVLIGHCCKENA